MIRIRAGLRWAENRSTGPYLIARWITALALQIDASRLPGSEPDSLPASIVKQLERPAEIHWQGVPLVPSLQRLASSHQIGIFVDRRLDPDQAVEFSSDALPLRELLEQFAKSNGWSISAFAPVIYLGPTATAQELATQYALQLERVRRLPVDWQRRWTVALPTHWPMLTEPRALIEGWLTSANIPAAGLKNVPHDLWAGEEYPPLNNLQRMTLALAGFGLAVSVQPDGSAKIEPLSSGLVVTVVHRIMAERRRALPNLRQQIPDSDLALEGEQLRVTGRVEDQQIVRQWLLDLEPGRTAASTRGSRSEMARKRFTLTVKNQTVGDVLQAVAQQVDLQVVWSPEVTEIRTRRVSLAVANVGLPELVRRLLDGTGARFRLAGNRLTISREDAGAPRQD
jgi:hypothetical protein